MAPGLYITPFVTIEFLQATLTENGCEHQRLTSIATADVWGTAR
jgi:hypothetical protein